MKVWESKDKRAYITIGFGSNDFDPEGVAPGTNNCGVGTLTGITLSLHVVDSRWGPSTMSLFRPAPAIYTGDYIRQYKQVYGREPPCQARDWDEKSKKFNIPQFSPAEIYDMVKAKFVDFVMQPEGGVRYGLYLLSNRVVDGNDTVFNRAKYPFETRGTAWLMKLIRDTKCGTLITSPVVENVSHPGQSGVMVGMWVPPNSKVLYEKVGISKGYDESRLERIKKDLPALAEGTPKFVDYFYGRKTVSSRLEKQNSDGAGVTMGAAAAR